MRRFLSKSASRSGESESEENNGGAGGSAGGNTAYEKRRAQVRKAQRRHRDRKANYIKALEHEVVNLRAENQDRVNEVLFLRGLLKENGVFAPVWQSTASKGSPGLDDLDIGGKGGGGFNTQSPPAGVGPGDGDTVTLTVSKGGKGATPLHVALLSSTSLHGGNSGIDDLTAGIGGLQPTSSPFQPGSIAAAAPDPVFDFVPASYSGQSNGIVQAGQISNRQRTEDQDFVDALIGLEHPCMAHPDMTSDHFGTHSHMASYQLLQPAPSSVSSGRSTGPVTWQVPGANIKQLLALSKSFNLPGELTPVQAWYRLRSDPRFGNMHHEQLDRLKTLLFFDVKCYGFGAVIDEDIWALAVEEVLSSVP